MVQPRHGQYPPWYEGGWTILMRDGAKNAHRELYAEGLSATQNQSSCVERQRWHLAIEELQIAYGSFTVELA